MRHKLLSLTVILVLISSLVACGTPNTNEDSEKKPGNVVVSDGIEGFYWLFIDEEADEYDDLSTGHYFDGNGNYKFSSNGYSYDAQYQIVATKNVDGGVEYTIDIYQDGDVFANYVFTLTEWGLKENVDYGNGSGGIFTYSPVDENAFNNAFE